MGPRPQTDHRRLARHAAARECEESLRRLNTDRVELYYLHAPDPKVPLAESAAAIGHLLQAGKIRCAGLSNATVAQLKEFAAVCPLMAYQPPYNMLQREIESRHAALVPRARSVSDGLLAARLRVFDQQVFSQTHVFPGRQPPQVPDVPGGRVAEKPGFSRCVAANRSGSRVISSPSGRIIRTTTAREIGGGAICGRFGRTTDSDNAGAAGWSLTPDQLGRIDAALRRRAARPVTKGSSFRQELGAGLGDTGAEQFPISPRQRHLSLRCEGESQRV